LGFVKYKKFLDYLRLFVASQEGLFHGGGRGIGTEVSSFVPEINTSSEKFSILS
jgi:hypothetical protein